LLGEIRQIFAALPDAEDHALLIAGPPGFAVATRDRIQTDVRILSGVSVLLILLLAWGGFRRPMLVVLLGLPMAVGVLAGLAAVQAVFGFVHGITLAFGACLVGIAIDYPLHVLAHAAKDGSTAQSARAIWPTLRLSAITTVAAFVPFMMADFPGLAQIGLFVAAGLVAAVLSGRFLFPLLCPTVTHFPLPDRLIERFRRLAPKLRWPLIVLPFVALMVLALRWDSVGARMPRRSFYARKNCVHCCLGCATAKTSPPGAWSPTFCPASPNSNAGRPDCPTAAIYAAGLPRRWRARRSEAKPSIHSWPMWSACVPPLP
jgi:predicted exporter